LNTCGRVVIKNTCPCSPIDVEIREVVTFLGENVPDYCLVDRLILQISGVVLE